MKKIVSGIMAFLLISVLAACQSTNSTEESGSKKLTLATWHASDYLTDAVKGFNASQNNYQIEIKDYGVYDNYESDIPGDSIKGQTMLNMDIAAGNIPDLINLHGIDRTTYAKNGAFINLYDFIKTDDQYNEKTLLTNYLHANEINGNLYWISPTFFVDSMIANTQMTQGMTKWSMEQFLAASKTAFDQHIEIMEHQSPTEFMTLMGAGNQFLDQITEDVRYDEPVFAKALQFSALLNDSHGHDHGHSHSHEVSPNEDAQKYANNQRLLGRATFSNYEEYLSYFALFGKQKATMIGYPTLNDSSGTYFGMGHDMYAISSSSIAPEGAWEYIKFALDYKDNDEAQFPIVKEKLEKKIQNSLTSYTDGEYQTRRGVDLTLDKPTQANLDEFMDMITNIKYFANYESMFSKEIYSLYDDFYAGTKTSDEVAQILQNKYTLYFKENQ